MVFGFPLRFRVPRLYEAAVFCKSCDVLRLGWGNSESSCPAGMPLRRTHIQNLKEKRVGYSSKKLDIMYRDDLEYRFAGYFRHRGQEARNARSIGVVNDGFRTDQ